VPAQNRQKKNRENLQRTIRLNLPAAPPRTLLHPVHRRAPAIGRAGLRNLIHSDPAPGEGEKGFSEALCATAQTLPHRRPLRPRHHGSSTSSSVGATRRRQARGGANRRRRLLCLVIPVGQETYGFLFLIISFIPSMIWLGLILLLQYFILNYIMSIFRSISFLYAIFVMVMIYLRINLKLKFLFFPTNTSDEVTEGTMISISPWSLDQMRWTAHSRPNSVFRIYLYHAIYGLRPMDQS
jgi:hypothetical protein